MGMRFVTEGLLLGTRGQKTKEGGSQRLMHLRQIPGGLFQPDPKA